MPPPSKIAVVGCGISGLGAIRSIVSGLRASDKSVSIHAFDKAMSVGGRCWTTHLRPALSKYPHTVDTGAQYATLRESPHAGSAFADWFAQAAAAGQVAPWYIREGDAERDRVIEQERGMMSKDGHTYRYTGVGGMRSMAEWARTDATVLADEVPAASLAWHTSQRVGRIEKSGSGSSYLLFSDPADELLGEYGAVLLAIPAPQVDALLRASALPVPDDLPTMEPVVAFAFPVPNDDASWSALAAGNFAPAGSPVVAWLARNSSKAGQRGPAGSDAVILVHSTPSFAGQARAEGWTKNRIRAEMADAVEATFKVTVPELARSQGLVHQWRYARVAETSGDGSAQAPSPSPSASPFITVSGETCLLAAGDWAVQGGRIQGAFESGTVAGGEILSRLEAKL